MEYHLTRERRSILSGKINHWSASAVTSLEFVMFIVIPTLCFCFPISSSPLSCFIETEVLITAPTNLELTEYLPHGITRKTRIFTIYQILINIPLLFLQCFSNRLLSFYDSEDKKNQAIKKNF